MNLDYESISLIINELINSINNYKNLIYKKRDKEAYQLLTVILDEIEKVLKLNLSQMLSEEKKNCFNLLESKLPYLLNALENDDKLFISDILNYEIKPLLSIYLE